jgi:hypothetical protein
MRRSVLVGCLAILASCNGNTVPPDSSGDTVPASTVSSEDADRQAIEKLEAEARAIAKADGCAASSDCRVAPIGVRGCGGPRDFIVYCAKTTDSASLARKIAAADSAESAFNQKYKIGSTCELRMAPAVAASGGICSAN